MQPKIYARCPSGPVLALPGWQSVVARRLEMMLPLTQLASGFRQAVPPDMLLSEIFERDLTVTYQEAHLASSSGQVSQLSCFRNVWSS